MRIEPKDLSVFQALHLAQFGEELTEEQASEKASRLLRLMTLIYEPMTKEEYDEVMARQAQIRNSASYRSRRLVPQKQPASLKK